MADNSAYMSSGSATTAGGYPDYSAYCTPSDTNKFLDVFWCTSLFEGVGRSNILTGLKGLGQTVRYHTFGTPTVHDYVKNGGMQFDTVSSCAVDFKLDTIRYSAMKYDVTDEKDACMFPAMRSEWQSRAPKVHSEQFDSRLMCTLPTFASACTVGNAAGAGGDVKLGTELTPVPVSGKLGVNIPAGATSVFEYMTRGQEVIGSFRLPTQGTIISYIPDKLRWLMINSEFGNNAQINGASGTTWMGGGPLNGYCGDSVTMRCGHEVRSSTCINKVADIVVGGVSKAVYRILWIWKDGFSSKNDSHMMMNGERGVQPMSRLDIRMTISGAAVSHREGVAVGYVYIAD